MNKPCGVLRAACCVGLLWLACASPPLEAAPRVGQSDAVDASAPNDTDAPLPSPSSPEHSLEAPQLLSLKTGEIQSIPVEGLTRVAIGNPLVADVTIVSSKALLLQATAAGTTNLILWDQRGQHAWNVEVLDSAKESVELQLRQMIHDLNLPDVRVTREHDKLFLTGQVPGKQDVDRLDQLLSAYKDKVTNLVSVAPAQPAPPLAPPSVKLTVQLIEMTRDATDKFGVDWMKSLTFTETTFGVKGPTGNLSLPERIEDAFRIGAVSRSGTGGNLSAVLNLLVTQGKARVLAEPKLVAASGKEATATIGVEVPVITATSVSSGTVSQSIEFKKTGVELKFQPTVLEDGHSIRLSLDAKVSSIDTTNAITVSGIVVPGFRVRQTQTEIVLDSGQVLLIAGLIQDEEKKNLSQLPGIGSIPVLGNLFRSTQFVRGQTELIMIVTPELTGENPMTADRAFTLDQALVSAEAAAGVNDPVLRYALQVQDRLAKAIRYPPRDKDQSGSGRVKLRLHLLRDGTLGQAIISESSGIQVFDLEALKVAESQSPYPPFPTELSQSDLWLELPVLFRP